MISWEVAVWYKDANPDRARPTYLPCADRDDAISVAGDLRSHRTTAVCARVYTPGGVVHLSETTLDNIVETMGGGRVRAIR